MKLKVKDMLQAGVRRQHDLPIFVNLSSGDKIEKMGTPAHHQDGLEDMRGLEAFQCARDN